MKIAIIGATGFVGKALVNEALERGLQVLAVARDTSKLTIANDHLIKENVDVNDIDTLAKILTDSDVVISSFNAGWTNPNIYEDNSKGLDAIEAAVVQSGVKHYIVIGGAGTLQIDGKQLVDGPDFPAEIKPGATSVRDYYNRLKENKVLDWTFFSPAIEMHPGITTGRTGKYRTGTTSPVFDAAGRSVLSVEDLSIALIDEAQNPQFIKQQFTAAY
jgi:putative NADH-flavin reductase